MVLRQFISKTIVSIIYGIRDAQKKSKKSKAYINPGGLMRTQQAISSDAIWDNRNNNIARLVNFDIAITEMEGEKKEAKIGVAKIFEINAGTSSENKESAIHRIQFSVPILFPTQELPKEAREKKVINS